MLFPLYQFNVLSERIKVHSGDVIGWTNEQQHSLISYSVVSGYLMRFHSIAAGMTLPALNQTVTLERVIYPGVFSVAVEITQKR